MTQDNPAHHPHDPHDPHAQPIDPPNPAAPHPAAASGVPRHAPRPAPVKRKRRWLRRIVIGVVVLLLLIGLLVALVPTIISTGAVRSMVLGKVNANLNGKVEVASWSVSWTGGISADGVKIFDASGVQIASIDHFKTGLSLIGAARGQFHLGDTVVDGLDFNAERYPDGTLNFAKLVKTDPNAPKTPEKPAPQQPAPGTKAEPTKLPSVDGTLKLVNCRGTFQDDAKKQTVHFDTIAGDVKIPSINDPIEDALQLVAHVGTAKSGSTNVDGKLLIAKNNLLLDPDQMDVHQKLTINTLELASLAPMLPPEQGIATLTGLTAGHFNLDVTPNQGASLDGLLESKNFKLGGDILKGDTYAADAVTIAIPKTVVDMSPGLGGKVENYRIRVGAPGSKEAITLHLAQTIAGKPSQSSVMFTADVTPGQLQNLGKNLPPGGDGTVRAAVDLDLAALAASLPHTLSLQPNTRLDSGRLTTGTDVTLAATKATLHQSLSIKDIVGQDTAAKKEIRLQPVDLVLTATDLGGGGGGAIPDVRDILLKLTTGASGNGGYASADVKAATLSDLDAKVHVALDGFQKEWSQLIDFGGVQLAGTLDLTDATKGDLIGDGKKPVDSLTADTNAQLIVRNLRVTGLKDKPELDEPYVGVGITATLQRGASAFVQAIKNLHTTIQTRDTANPTVDVDITGNVAFVPDNRPGAKAGATTAAADLKIVRVIVNPAQLQQEFGAFLPLHEYDLTFRGGMIGVNGTIHSDANGAAVATNVNLNNLVLDKGTGAATEKVFDKYTMGVQLDANYAGDAAGNTKITVAKLMVGDDPNSPQSLVGIENADGKPIEITSQANGQMQGSGALHIIRLNLARLNEIAQAFSKAPATTTTVAGAPPSPQVVATTTEPGAKMTSGWLAGTLGFGTDAQQQLKVDGNLDVTSLSITVPRAKGLQNEQIKIALAATASQNFASATVPHFDVTGSMLTMHVSDTQVQLKDGPGADAKPVPTLQMVRKAVVRIEVPALEKLQALLDAVSPPAAPGAAKPVTGTASASADPRGALLALANPKNAPKPVAAPAAAPPEPPVKLAGGSLTADLNVNLDPNTQQLLIVPNVTGKNVLLSKDNAPDPIGDLAVSGQVAIVPAGTPVVAEQPTDGLAGAFAAVKSTAQAAARPVTVAKAAVVSTQPATQPSVMDQIAAVRLTNLAILGVGSGVKVNGSVEDLAKARRLRNLTLDLTYNAGMLWNAVLPLMSKESQTSLADVKVAGNHQKLITLGGSYPADVPFNQAVSALNANGEVLLDLFEHKGMTLKNFLLPFVLDGGKARVVLAGKPDGQNLPAPAEFNGGKLSLGGTVMDLAPEHPTVTIPAGTKLLENASLNPTFAAWSLGDYVNNPLFVGAEQAAGLLNVTINKCENLPVDATVTEQVPSNQGVLDVTMTINKIQIGNENINKVAGALASTKIFGGKSFAANSLQGEVKDFHVHMEHGVTSQNLALAFGEHDRPLNLAGDVHMATRNLNMNMELPWGLFGIKPSNDLLKFAGSGVNLPLSGTPQNLQFNMAAAVQKNIGAAPQNILQNLLNPNAKNNAAGGGGQNPLDMFKGIAGGGDTPPKNAAGQPTSQPAASQPADPTQQMIQDLGKLFGNDKDKDKNKDKKKKKK